MLSAVLDQLEAYYGPQRACWPVDPYEFLVWWHCGYPPSDAACAKGWAALRRGIGTEPRELVDADLSNLAGALKAGGMVPELRATRLKEIAGRVLDEFAGDLRGALTSARARTLLKKFPGISDPGAERILLFAGVAVVAAVPSNCPHVAGRIRKGREKPDYTSQYRVAREIIENEVPATQADRERAFLLLKHHGQTICRRNAPDCGICPVSASCAAYAGR